MPRKSVKWFGGVDPGVSGGLFLMETSINGNLLACHHQAMPDTALDIWAAINDFYANATFVLLEKVASSPQMGVSSSFTFGNNYGRIEGCLAASRVPHALVTPQVWQGALGVPKKPQDMKQHEHKRRLRAFAQRLYPNLDLWDELLGYQDKVADALLITEHCRRSMLKAVA